ncbi:MAG TPA: hypothetical protein VGF67_11745 [Ktedonobacteraceae bacterium]
MRKFTKFAVATVLGLTFVLSVFSSGAFAQSTTQSVTHRAMTVLQVSQTAEHGVGDRTHENNWQGNRWTGDRTRGQNWQSNRWRTGRSRCVRVVRWMGPQRAARPVVSWVCHR